MLTILYLAVDLPHSTGHRTTRGLDVCTLRPLAPQSLVSKVIIWGNPLACRLDCGEMWVDLDGVLCGWGQVQMMTRRN